MFRITLDASYRVLHNFNGPQGVTDGVRPEAPLVAGDATFYGTTSSGGPFGYGTVLRITPDGTFAVLHAFTDTEGITCRFEGLVRATGGNFYGVGGDRTFQLTPDGTLTVVHTFAAGSQPSQLIQASDGNFYGMTRYGGTGQGIVFRITLP